MRPPVHIPPQSRRPKHIDRRTPNERGYTHAWHVARTAYLRENPLCVSCARHGRTTAATCVDHVTPHRGDMDLFWDQTNWQALCHVCHSVKTGKGQ